MVDIIEYSDSVAHAAWHMEWWLAGKPYYHWIDKINFGNFISFSTLAVMCIAFDLGYVSRFC